MLKPEEQSFPPLDCSRGPTLGDYYQDLTPALQMVEEGYHGGFDDDGVALVDYAGQGSVRNSITIAQYALANMTAARRGDHDRSAIARVQLDSLVADQSRDGEWTGCWVMAHADPKYHWLTPPWTSAMASGNAISALLRGWETFGETVYREAASNAYDALHRPRPVGRRLYDDAAGWLWYEEYPANPPLRVLNGHIYAALGVLDFARVEGEEAARQRWLKAASTVRDHLEGFDLGYWSAYDLRDRAPVSVHYQRNIHVPLLRIMSSLLDDPYFATFADRWEAQTESRWCLARWQVGLRVHPRRKRLRSAWAQLANRRR